MAFIAGYGGTLTLTTGGGTAISVAVKSFTMNIERASLDATLLSDFREKRLPGRVRRSGTMTLYRQDSTTDDAIRAHIIPADLTAATGTVATLKLKYVDQGTISYDEFGSGTGAFNIHITSASISDNGTDVGLWELSWDEQ